MARYKKKLKIVAETRRIKIIKDKTVLVKKFEMDLIVLPADNHPAFIINVFSDFNVRKAKR